MLHKRILEWQAAHPNVTWARVNYGLSQPTAATSAFRGKADANDAKADMPAAMSAVEGRADVVCQGLSGPFLATKRRSGLAINQRKCGII